MVLSCNALAEEISRGSVSAEGIAVVPTPDLEALKKGGEPSIPLRLGRWFLSMRLSNESNIPATHDPKTKHGRIGKHHFVPFGATFVLHPNRFVLASTLEWIRLSERFVAFVVGKSTLGRRGIVIETAAGVHPGFSGCLTLEIANVGEMPVSLVAGMMIGQLFVHKIEGESLEAKTSLAGQRKPRIGAIRKDPTLSKLMSRGG
jgi:dCTP deaminase